MTFFFYFLKLFLLKSICILFKTYIYLIKIQKTEILEFNFLYYIWKSLWKERCEGLILKGLLCVYTENIDEKEPWVGTGEKREGGGVVEEDWESKKILR